MALTSLTTLWGETEAGLLEALRTAREDYKKGSAIIHAQSGDVETGKMIQANAEERIQNIQAQLFRLDPETYSNFELSGYNQTRAVFS